MKPIEEVYPQEYKHFYVGNYQPMLESFGYPILLQVDDNDYQGDSRLIFQDGDRYGMLVFGWGSCSGCDSLQACNTLEDVDTLRKELLNSIKWYDSAQAMLEFFNTHDWEGDYSWHSTETQEFVEKAKALMGERCKSQA